MTRKTICTIGVLLGSAAAVLAAKGDNQKLLGTWQRNIDDNHMVKFAFKAEDLHVTITSADAVVDVDADYGVTANGILYGIVTHVDKKGTEGGPVEGQLFSFRFSVSDNKDALKITEVKGTDITDESRQLIEGDYAPEKKK